jgi:hypothetical protein
MMVASDGQSDQVVVAALDHHDQYQRCGLPVISVLVGPVARALRSVQQWAKTLEMLWSVLKT